MEIPREVQGNYHAASVLRHFERVGDRTRTSALREF
jgi:hypothetical protein